MQCNYAVNQILGKVLSGEEVVVDLNFTSFVTKLLNTVKSYSESNTSECTTKYDTVIYKVQ